jgi:hypothetical protein
LLALQSDSIGRSSKGFGAAMPERQAKGKGDLPGEAALPNFSA